MASWGKAALLPQCTLCTQRATRPCLEAAWRPFQQQVRGKTKAAKEAERNIPVRLLKDMPRFGRAGSYVPIPPALMRNKWYPLRLADYVPKMQIKQLKAEGVSMVRDVEFGVQQLQVEEAEAEEEYLPTHYVRPVEIEFLGPARSMELLDTFIPPTIDFARQPIEQEKLSKDAAPRLGASDAADILSAAAALKKPEATGIYGSVSTADIAATVKLALSHNDEAARVIISESDVRFLEGHAEGDASRVKQLGTFKVEISLSGAESTITRTVRVRARE